MKRRTTVVLRTACCFIMAVTVAGSASNARSPSAAAEWDVCEPHFGTLCVKTILGEAAYSDDEWCVAGGGALECTTCQWATGWDDCESPNCDGDSTCYVPDAKPYIINP